jgi:uncharacterized protein (DUF58 family)
MLLAFGLGTAAASVASLPLFAVAIGLALITTSAGVVVRLAASRVTVARTISHHEAQEGDPICLSFDVRGLGWLPVSLETRDQFGGWVLLSPAGATIELALPSPGSYRLLASELRLRDALGIFDVRLRGGQPQDVLILPVPDVTAGSHFRDRSGLDDHDPDGIRPYAPGTPIARIDWTSLARGIGLQARHFSAGPRGMPLVVVDTAGAPSEGALDWTARTAAGCVLSLARAGGCRVLLPGDTAETRVTDVDREWRTIHRRLATLVPAAMEATVPRSESGAAIRVRARAAPPGLPLAPPLPQGVVPIAPWRP